MKNQLPLSVVQNKKCDIMLAKSILVVLELWIQFVHVLICSICTYISLCWKVKLVGILQRNTWFSTLFLYSPKPLWTRNVMTKATGNQWQAADLNWCLQITTRWEFHSEKGELNKQLCSVLIPSLTFWLKYLHVLHWNKIHVCLN